LSSQGDVLGAASLILALLGVVYALWYPEIVAAINLEPKAVRTQADYDQARSVLWKRAVPLTAATILDLAVFLPSSLSAALPWADGAFTNPLRALDHYDAEPVALNLASLLTLGLVVETTRLAKKLSDHCRKDLRP
jgi:hypothetical protein